MDDMAAKKKEERLYVSRLGEYYDDCLKVEAALKERTKAFEGASLLCSTLMRRKSVRDEMVTYLAKKHGMTFDEMWQALRDGTFKPSSDEVNEIDAMDEAEDPEGSE